MSSEILKLSEYLYFKYDINNLYLLQKQAKIKQRMFKLATSTIDLGDPIQAGRGIAEIIKFLLKKIDLNNRPKSQYNLKKKIWNLNEFQMSNKKSPASASLGQSLSFVKNVLNGHNPSYIRAILREIVENL